MATLQGKLSISKDSQGQVTVRIADQASGITFVTAALTGEEFANALFGLARTSVTLTVEGLDHVGHVKETEAVELKVLSRKIHASSSSVSTKECELYLVEHYQRPGWFLNPSLNSKGSLTVSGKYVVMRVTYYRYLKEE